MGSIAATLCTTLLQVLYVVDVSQSSPTQFTSESSIRPLTSKSPQQLWCPPGFIYSTDTNNCECYPNSNVVCNENKASLNFASCMTYKEEEGTFLGLCISFLAHGRNVSNRLYLDLPGNLTDLNDFMCGPMNRKGLICSECIDGFAPAITSLACIWSSMG